MNGEELAPAPFLYLHSLADLDTVAVDVEHEFVGWIEEANHINVILEVGVERIVVGGAAIASAPPESPLTSSTSAGP
jgi:hypothetical protein